MGYKLTRWAQSIDHPCLMKWKRTRQVLVNMCLVAQDEHSEFGMRGREFIEEYIPDMTYGAYKNHLSRLGRNGLIIKVQHGGGPTGSGGGTVTCYRINAPSLLMNRRHARLVTGRLRQLPPRRDNYTPWDSAALLADDETIIEYLEAALEENDHAFLKKAVVNVIRAKSLNTTQLRRVGPA